MLKLYNVGNLVWNISRWKLRVHFALNILWLSEGVATSHVAFTFSGGVVRTPFIRNSFLAIGCYWKAFFSNNWLVEVAIGLELHFRVIKFYTYVGTVLSFIYFILKEDTEGKMDIYILQQTKSWTIIVTFMT